MGREFIRVPTSLNRRGDLNHSAKLIAQTFLLFSWRKGGAQIHTTFEETSNELGGLSRGTWRAACKALTDAGLIRIEPSVGGRHKITVLFGHSHKPGDPKDFEEDDAGAEAPETLSEIDGVPCQNLTGYTPPEVVPAYRIAGADERASERLNSDFEQEVIKRGGNQPTNGHAIKAPGLEDVMRAQGFDPLNPRGWSEEDKALLLVAQALAVHHWDMAFDVHRAIRDRDGGHPAEVYHRAVLQLTAVKDAGRINVFYFMKIVKTQAELLSRAEVKARIAPEAPEVKAARHKALNKQLADMLDGDEP